MNVNPLSSADSNSANFGAAATPIDAGDAVGVRKSDKKWFVAIVTNNTEKSVATRLSEMGFETFVASQLQIRLWRNGRRVKIEKVLIPTFVFVKCTETERRIIVTFPFIRRFLSDRARRNNGLASPLAIIPETQIDTLRFMLGQSENLVSFTEHPMRPGDKVRVIRGSLRGLVGEVLSPSRIRAHEGDANTEILVQLDILGSAKVSIPSPDLQQI